MLSLDASSVEADDEEARRPVHGLARRRAAPVTISRGGRPERTARRRCGGGRRLRRAGTRRGEAGSQPVETRRTPGSEPGATSRDVRGGGSRRGGEKPRGRNVIVPGRHDPAGRRWRHRRSPEWTPRARDDGGAYFDNPRRGFRCESVGRPGSKRVEKAQTQRSGGWNGSTTCSLNRTRRPVPRSTGKDAVRAASPKCKEDSSRTNRLPRSTGTSPAHLYQPARGSPAKRATRPSGRQGR